MCKNKLLFEVTYNSVPKTKFKRLWHSKGPLMVLVVIRMDEHRHRGQVMDTKRRKVKEKADSRCSFFLVSLRSGTWFRTQDNCCSVLCGLHVGSGYNTSAKTWWSATTYLHTRSILSSDPIEIRKNGYQMQQKFVFQTLSVFWAWGRSPKGKHLNF